MNKDRVIKLFVRLKEHHDFKAFEEIVREMSRYIRAIAYRHLHDSGEAEDVAQEAFATFGREYWRIREMSPIPWLRKTTFNRCQRRRRKKPPPIPIGDDIIKAILDNEENKGEDPLEQMMRKEKRDEVRKALDSLSDVQKECLRMRYIEGLDYKDIAAKLNRTVSDIHSQVFQAKKRLREKGGLRN